MTKNFIKNVGLSGSSSLINQGLTLILFFIAARFLGPAEIGLFAIISIVVAYANLLGEYGGSAYLVHTEDYNASIVDAVFSLNLLIAIILTVIFYFSAGLIYKFFNLTELFPIQLATFTIFFFSLGGVFKGVLQRELSFKKLSLSELLASLISFFNSIVILLLDYGVLALVSYPLVRGAVELLINMHFTNRRYSLNFDFRVWKKIYNFSIYLLINNTINQASRSADQMIIGKQFGDMAVGVYSVAYKIMLFPVHRFVGIISKVAFPTLASQRENYSKLGSNYTKMVVVAALGATTIVSLIWFNTDVFVRTLLGDRWIDVVPLLNILVPVAIIQSVMSTVGSLFLITGKTKYGLKLQIISTTTTIFAFIFGSQWGVIGICWSYLISNLLLFPPLYSASISLIGLKMSDVSGKLLINIICGVLIGYFCISTTRVMGFIPLVEIIISFTMAILILATYVYFSLYNASLTQRISQ
jgi:O-antigen/teichoic acid export membrane protein